MRYAMRISSLLVLTLVPLLGDARAATITVAPDGSGDHPTIQAAIDAAVDGDVVELTDGTFAGAGNRDIQLRGKAITVRSASGEPATCVIDAEGTSAEPHRCIIVQEEEGASTRIEGLTLTGGVAPSSLATSPGGGGLLIIASPTIERCVITGNRGPRGAGMLLGTSSSIIRDCVIEHNIAEKAAGGGGSGGGGIALEKSNAQIVDCIIRANRADAGGGITDINGGTDTFRNCLVSGNIAEFGGGILANTAQTYLVSCTVSGNHATAGDGGGLYALYSDVYIERSIISGNCAALDGDDVWVDEWGAEFTCTAIAPEGVDSWEDQGWVVYTDEPVTADPRLCEPAAWVTRHPMRTPRVGCPGARERSGTPPGTRARASA